MVHSRECGNAPRDSLLGPPAIGALSHPFFLGWEGSPTKIDYRKKVGTLIRSSPLENLVFEFHLQAGDVLPPKGMFGAKEERPTCLLRETLVWCMFFAEA